MPCRETAGEKAANPCAAACAWPRRASRSFSSPTGPLTGLVPTRRRARYHLRAPCAGYSPQAGYPEAFRARMQVFRSYDAEGVITGGRLCGPQERAEDVIAEIFEDESVERIHTRNVVFGCYMLQIRRAP